MSQLAAEVALLHPIYSVYFKIVAEEQGFGVKEDRSGSMDFHLTYPLHSSQRDQNNDQAEYDVFDSDNLKDMAKILGASMKPGVLAHLFFSAQQFALFYSPLASENKKKRNSSREDSGKGKSEGKKTEGLELRPVF